MKGSLLIILSIIYSQNQGTLVFNSNYSSKKKPSFHMWNYSYQLSNNMLIINSDSPNWFYSMGPYNDTWGSDIYLTKLFSNTKSLSYFPFENPILSLRTNYNAHGLKNGAQVFLNILGLNIKKLKVGYQNRQFYGSEKKD